MHATCATGLSVPSEERRYTKEGCVVGGRRRRAGLWAVRPGVAPPRITTTAEMLLPQCQTLKLPLLYRKGVMTMFLKMRVGRPKVLWPAAIKIMFYYLFFDT